MSRHVSTWLSCELVGNHLSIKRGFEIQAAQILTSLRNPGAAENEVTVCSSANGFADHDAPVRDIEVLVNKVDRVLISQSMSSNYTK